jgi:hypothetical protein
VRVGYGQLARVSPADLDVPNLAQLAPAQLPLCDALEPGPLEVVRLNAALGGGPLRAAAGTRAAGPRRRRGTRR